MDAITESHSKDLFPATVAKYLLIVGTVGFLHNIWLYILTM